MTTTLKEEAINKKDTRQMVLPMGLAVWFCILAGVIGGCGSGEGPSSPPDRKPAVSTTKPQVLEIRPDLPALDVMEKAAAARSTDPGRVEVIPPDLPGSQGMTEAEIMAKAPEPAAVDPNLIEVIPPDQPGGRGLTMAEVEAAQADHQEVNPIHPGVPPNDTP